MYCVSVASKIKIGTKADAIDNIHLLCSFTATDQESLASSIPSSHTGMLGLNLNTLTRCLVLFTKACKRAGVDANSIAPKVKQEFAAKAKAKKEPKPVTKIKKAA